MTATYDKYDMLPEKRTVVGILEAELRKIFGTRPISRAPLLVVGENVVSIVEGERRIVGSVNR